MPYTPIVGTLAYVVDRDARTVLLVHRTARADDEHLGKYNGLGGKLEADEDVAAGMRRELREEASIEVSAMALRATISWPGFGPNGEDWLGFVFVVDGWRGTVPDRNPEGTLHWVPLDRLLAACAEDPEVRAAAALPMWEGDRWFLPLVLDDDPRPLHGVMPYSGGRPTGWRYERW
ncbi:MAG: 8-oxo-dGTP diphosphatase [Acidimicrobiia bacterium]|nr:8-oxo-dGTP diphosphatase [Acidimicrobiia bacterium]